MSTPLERARGMLLTGYRTCDEYAPIDDTYNPAIHRISHALKMRAVHPDKPIPEMPAELLKFSVPPANLIEKARSRIETLTEAAGVKKGADTATSLQRRSLTAPQYYQRQRAAATGRP